MTTSDERIVNAIRDIPKSGFMENISISLARIANALEDINKRQQPNKK